MSSNVNKSVKDPKNILKEKELRLRTDKMIEKSESKEIIPLNWEAHIKAGHKIKSFTSIVNNQMYVAEPMKNMQLVPFFEYMGSYGLNWILNWDTENKREIWRKNIMYVDLIEWEIS